MGVTVIEMGTAGMVKAECSLQRGEVVKKKKENPLFLPLGYYNNLEIYFSNLKKKKYGYPIKGKDFDFLDPNEFRNLNTVHLVHSIPMQWITLP